MNRAQRFLGHGSLAHDCCYCLQKKKLTANSSRTPVKKKNVITQVITALDPIKNQPIIKLASNSEFILNKIKQTQSGANTEDF